MNMEDSSLLLQTKNIKNKIYTIRRVQVMLDTDLAELYEVQTKVFVTSNVKDLRPQFVTLKKGRGEHRKYLPYAFTEQGVAMLSGILKSKTAIRVSIQIINAFVAMRNFIAANAEIFQRLERLEIVK